MVKGQQTTDLCIVGGGIIGLTAAWYAAKAGLKVTVIDRADFGREASWAGAGILPHRDPRKALSQYTRLIGLSSELWPQLAAELHRETGLDTDFHNCGELELSFEEEHAARLDTNMTRYRQEGVICDALNDTQLHQREKHLGPDWLRAYHLPQTNQTRNPRHLAALLAGLRGLGVTLLPNTAVESLMIVGRRIEGVCLATTEIRAAHTLLACGAWANQVLAPLEVQVPIKPIRGQIALLRTATPLFRHILTVGSRYLVPRRDGHVLVGSTEEDVGFDKRVTAEQIQALLAFAFRVVPALRDAELVTTWAGFRPGSPDGFPLMGPIENWQGLWLAGGHYRFGLQLATGSGWLLTELIQGRADQADWCDFQPNRFQPTGV